MTVSVRVAFAAALLVLVACDDKKDMKDTPSASASAAPMMSAPPPMASTAPAMMTASAAPSAAPSSSSSMITNEDLGVILTMKDPSKEPEKTLEAMAGKAVTVFLPDVEGTVWSADTIDKSLGKPKEEMMPGMAPKTMGHQFKWTGVKAGKVKVVFGNRKSGDKTGKPTQTFTLTIDAK